MFDFRLPNKKGHQLRFLKKSSTTDEVNLVVNMAKVTLKEDKCEIITFDMKNTFDCAWWCKMLEPLIKLGGRNLWCRFSVRLR